MIDALLTKYKLKEVLTILDISKSSYYYQKNALLLPSKYFSVTTLIKDIFKESKKTYGYRRIDVELKKSGVFMSDKVIRKIMRSEKLNVIFTKRKSMIRNYEKYRLLLIISSKEISMQMNPT